MPRLAIIAIIEITPGRIDDYIALAVVHRGRCSKDEPGALAFEALRPRNDDNKVMLYELCADDAPLDGHWNGTSLKQIRQEAEAAGIALKISGVRCTSVELGALSR
jgi:(4S)-4-hydroxy-5-phosphonooxypentane-2,3-dione isomerase